MRKRTLLSLTLLFLSLIFSPLWGQGIYAFPDSGAYWNYNWVVYPGDSGPGAPHGVLGDTTINGSVYHIVASSGQSFSWDPQNARRVAYVRVDSNQWWFRPAQDSTDYLLYDWSLRAGDIFVPDNPWSQYAVGPWAVESVDTVIIGGVSRKRIRFNLGHIEEWIEGIGSTRGIIYAFSGFFDATTELMCFHQNDTLVFNNSPDGNCYYYFAGIGEEELGGIGVVPHPIQDQSRISWEGQQNFTANLFDLQGQWLRSLRSRGTEMIFDRKNLPPGMYILDLQTQSGLRHRRKLIVE